MELRLGLFADRSAGMPWWDAIRYRAFEYTFDRLTGNSVPAVPARALFARARNHLRRLMLRTRLRARIALFRYDVLVLRAPRQMLDGRRVDAGLDDLIALCPGRKLVIETYPLYYHLPRRGSSRRQVALGTALDRVLTELESEFGPSAGQSDLRAMIGRLLADFAGDHAVYGRLLDRVRPRFILMTQNGLEKAFFAAARARAIPVVEAQHGLIGPTHAAYSYPENAELGDRSTFPSVFLSFSNYWLERCNYPAERRVAIGNERFLVPRLPPAAPPGDIMFVSADIYHDVLFDWALRLAQALPDRRIVYKLHPNQQAAGASIALEAAGTPNLEIIDGAISARELLFRVAHVVLIQSTVALETLQSGRRLCVLPVAHYHVHEDLFGMEPVTVTHDLTELMAAVRKESPKGSPPSFFDAFDAATASSVLSELSERGARDGG